MTATAPSAWDPTCPAPAVVRVFGDFRFHTDGDLLALMMIETAEGLANVAEIARTPGLDALYIGPGDLAIALALPLVPAHRTRNEQRTLDDAIERIRLAAESAHIVAGMYVGSGAEASRLVARGFRMVTVAWDAGLLEDGGRAELAAARGE